MKTLKELRRGYVIEGKPMTQKILGSRFDVPQSTVTNWERDSSRIPTEVLPRLCRLFDVKGIA